MRRFRNRGPSSAEMIRQTQVRKLLCRYGAYSRHLQSKSSTSLEASSSSKSLATSNIQLQGSSRRAGLYREGDDLTLTMKPSQLLSQNFPGIGNMDKGLALAAAQHVARVLANDEATGVDSQQVKEDFLHMLERDWGFAGAEALSLGRIRITIKRRDNDLENIRRAAELERAELEKNRLMQERGAQLRRVEVASSSQRVQSSTKVVKTRVVKTVKRTVQTVRAA